jgi:hypothetical protein
MLRSVEWYLVINVSGQPVGHIFLKCLTLENGTDRLSRNVGNVTTNPRCVTSQKSGDLVSQYVRKPKHRNYCFDAAQCFVFARVACGLVLCFRMMPVPLRPSRLCIKPLRGVPGGSVHKLWISRALTHCLSHCTRHNNVHSCNERIKLNGM